MDTAVGFETGQEKPASTTQPDGNRYDELGRWLKLAQENPEQCVKEIVAEWDRQNPAFSRRRRPRWDCNLLWYRGYRGVRAYPESQDTSNLRLYVPYGCFDVQPVMDRTAELSERITAHLLSDAPVPEPEPADDTDEARDAAEFAKRVLDVVTGESGCNYLAKVRRAHTKASIYGSGFLLFWTDPHGAGLQPKRIKAHPSAMTLDQATIDPTTGQEIQDESLLQDRFVAKSPEGYEGPPLLTDNEAEAETQWRPALRCDVLTGKSVRFMPEDCTGIDDATGVLVLRATTLGKLKDMNPALRDAPPDRLQKIIDWRPEALKWSLPAFLRDTLTTLPANADGTPHDDSVCCTLSVYLKQNYTYQKGAYICTAGGCEVVHAGTWMMQVDDQNGGAKEEPLDLPLSQIRQFDDVVGDDPYGYGLVEKVGPLDEVMGTITLGWLEQIDRFLRPFTWAPLGSPVQPEAMAVRTGEVLFYDAGAGVPVQEVIPAFDPAAVEFFDRAKEQQNDVSTMTDTAQGTEDTSSVSGIAKQVVVQQSQQNAASIRQNLGDGIQRGWRLILQQIRAFWTVPQQLQFTTEDGAYKVKSWTRADLGSTKDVKIAIGSFTQQTPQGKINQLGMMLQMGQAIGQPIVEADDVKRVASSAVNPVVGIQQSPVTERIRRQIREFKDGPQTGWVEQAQQVAQQNQMVGQQFQAAQQQAMAQGVDPATIPPPQLLPPPPNPFDRVPSDLEQRVAMIRHGELLRLTQSLAMKRWPPEWQNVALAEYEAMRHAAGIATIAEQQQAAMQQQQAQAQQEEGKEARDAEREDARSERGHEQQMEAQHAKAESDRTIAETRQQPALTGAGA